METPRISAMYKFFAVGLAVMAGYGILRTYMDSATDRARAESEVSVREALNRQLEARVVERKRLTDEKLAALDKLKRQPLKPKEIIREIIKYVPLPVAPTVKEPTPESPDQPVIAELPLADFRPLLDFLIECEKCGVSLEACATDVVDLQIQLVNTQKQRDAAIRGMKGGGFWRRLGRRVKDITIGVIFGAALAKAI